jgi:hypothetical protein
VNELFPAVVEAAAAGEGDMTPEQSEALGRASAALTRRIADLQRAIEAREPPPKLEEQLGQARGLHDALQAALDKAAGVDPRAQLACRKLGELLDGLERVMLADDAQ